MVDKKFDFKKIEKKWQDKWKREKVFEVDVSKKKKFFLTFPYPYINAYQHIGHLYTLMKVEAFARYKRLNGFNVLFPQGWHVTGSPIVNAAKRIKENEPKQLKIMKDMGIPDSEIHKFKDPEYWIKFFMPEYKKDYESLGMSIDWRREFHTTSLNPYYDKFIKWQFRKLKEKGYVIKGKYPVVWDPKEETAVGDHDRIEGEGEASQEFCLFKFPLDDGRNVITATLRPDTVLGITNVYVNPEIDYVEIETKGERWIVGEPIIEKLKNQEFDIKTLGRVRGRDLIGKKVRSFGGREILVLPATFLDGNYGTGMVHSVPSESADDLIALRDLQKNDEMIKKYCLDASEIKSIEPIEIFQTPGIEGSPAQYYLDKYNVKSQDERKKLEKIKKELYKLTFTKSRFNHLYKRGFSKNLEGVLVSKGQGIIKDYLFKKGKIEKFYELSGKVISRSLTECVVKIVDQWFLDYANPEWKKKAHECLKQIELFPEKVRSQFNYVIDWLHEWACAREKGLGTRLPWDKKWIIESLSDSTIYMAYYTISHLIKDVPIEEIDDKFFDYVFLGKGKGKKRWKRFRKEFEYWYPLDFRNSGKDLIQNHLTFFIFNHVAIFSKENWPKGIGVNGWVTVDGRKMSKSLGNMIPVRKAVRDYGADASRLTILNGGEGIDDPNWDSDFAASLKNRFNQVYDLIVQNYGKGGKEMFKIDEWMENRLSLYASKATEFMEKTLFRSATQKIFFDLISDFKWYLRRTRNPNNKIIKKVIESFIIMLNPFCPHFSEELWEKIGKEKFVSLDEWPKFKEKEFENTEENIKNLISDIRNLLGLVKKKPTKAFIYVIPKEKEIYNEASHFLSQELNLEVKVYAVNDKEKYDPDNKSKKTKPGKPGIYLE